MNHASRTSNSSIRSTKTASPAAIRPAQSASAVRSSWSVIPEGARAALPSLSRLSVSREIGFFDMCCPRLVLLTARITLANRSDNSRRQPSRAIRRRNLC